jgi:hypothetical protein
MNEESERQPITGAGEPLKSLKKGTMLKCPACGYKRQTRDDAIIPASECPQCGIIYSKYEKAKNVIKEPEQIILDLNQDQLKITAAKVLKCFRKLLGTVAEIILLIAFTAVAYISLLYFAKIWWVLFTATHVGQVYADNFCHSYRITDDVFSRDIISLAINLTLISFVISLVAGALCKFLHITRYFYSYRGFFGRSIFFGLPLTYIVAAYMLYTGDFDRMDTAFTVAAVPTLCVFTGCFRLAEEFMPELVDAISCFSKKGSV